MDDLNPYAAPPDLVERAKQVYRCPVMLQIPATALLAFSVLSSLALVSGAIILGFCIYMMCTGGLAHGPGPTEIIGTGLVGIAHGLGSLIVFAGAWNMRRLKRRRLAIAASIMACVPFVSPMVYFGIPFGIWALIMLFRPNVRAAFTS